MRRLKLLVYAQQFTGDCLAIYPFYAIMFSERGGLSVPQVSLLFGVWSIVALVCEIPTGVLADRFSRRYSIAGSMLLQAMALLIWLVYPGLLGYTVGFAVWGVGSALSSGAFQAYLYDELKNLGREDQFNKLYGRSQSLVFLGAGTAFLSSILIGTDNYNGLLVASIMVSLLSMVFALALPKERAAEHVETDIKPKYLRHAVRQVRHSAVLAQLVIGVALVATMVEVMDEYTPVYYQSVGVANDVLPIMATAGMAVTAGLIWFADKIGGLRVYLWCLLLLAGAVILILTGQSSLTAIAAAGMFIYMRLGYLAHVLFESGLQHRITGKARATVGSLATFSAEFLNILLFALLASTPIFDRYEIIVKTLGITAIFVALGLIVAWRYGRRMDNEVA